MTAEQIKEGLETQKKIETFGVIIGCIKKGIDILSLNPHSDGTMSISVSGLGLPSQLLDADFTKTMVKYLEEQKSIQEDYLEAL
jgi:hypothetical protein